jgi:hypothetical protein
MTVEELKEQLKQGIVEFSYTKKDGSIRLAHGTTKTEIIKEYNAEPKGTSDTKSLNDSVVRYFDIDAQGWRSFCSCNLL